MQPVQRFVSRCAGAKSPKSRPQPGKGSPDRGGITRRFAINTCKVPHICRTTFHTKGESSAVSGELDFFSYKVSLTPDQRSRCISYVLQLCKQREKLEFRLISGRIVNDFQYVADPNMFLSGAASYLRLDNNCPINRIAMVNNSVMEDRLSEYFDQVWNLDDQNVTKERNAIAEHIHHVLQGIHLITRAKSDEMEELQESWMNKF